MPSKGQRKDTKSSTRQAAGLSRVSVASLVPQSKRGSLVEWFAIYMTVDGKAGADGTIKEKHGDLKRFTQFFLNATGSDRCDDWTRSISSDFVKHSRTEPSARTGRPLRPATINRNLATLRTASKWIHGQRAFLAGWPMQGIGDIEEDDPEWQGLEAIEVTRLKAAAEQLIHIQRRGSQRPYRNFAILMVLLCTGLRQFELRSLDREQYEDKHFVNIRRKGRKVTRKLLVPKAARDALAAYFKHERSEESGPLMQTKTGERMAAQDLDAALKGIAKQANANLPAEERIHLTAHKLRHTALKQAANQYDVRFALELSGHTSPHYIWRYTGLTQAERDAMMEGLG